MNRNMKKIFSSLVLFFALFFIGNADVYANSNPVYWNINGSRITLRDYTKVAFEDISQVDHVITSYNDRVDVSRSGEAGTVIAYIVDGTLYVQFDGTLYFNADSSNMFNGNDNLTEITGFQYVNTSNVTSMANMFASSVKLQSLDLSNFNTANVTDMSSMFEGNEALTSLNVSSFNTANVTNMNKMFYGTKSLTSLNVTNFNTANVTDMGSMFESSRLLTTLNLSNFNTANVTDMSSMFKDMPALSNLTISSFRTPLVTDMSNMFNGDSSLTGLDLSAFNTSNVTTMQNMFKNCSSLTSLNVSSFDTQLVTNMNGMFSEVSSLATLNISSFRTPLVTTMKEMFYNMSSLTSLDVSQFVTTNVIDMSGMFYNINKLSSLSVTNFNTANVLDMSHMFEKLTISTLDVSNFNTAKVTNMSYMFAYMTNITVFNLDNFNTSRIAHIDYMFAGDTSLQRIWVTSDWSIPGTATGSKVFEDCQSLAVDYGSSYQSNRVDKTQAVIDTYNRIGYLNFHWSVTSSVHEVNYDGWNIDSLQRVFRQQNLTPSNNITTTLTTESGTRYYNIYYAGQLIRKFRIIQEILDINLTHDSAGADDAEGDYITIIRGRTYQLYSTVGPSNTTYSKTVNWTPGDQTILSVDSTGLVTGVGGGITTMTASSQRVRQDFDDTHSKSCTFEVVVPLTDFNAEMSRQSLQDQRVKIIPGQQYVIEREILPIDTTEDKTITWTTNNPNVVTIDADGRITGINPGETTVHGVIEHGRYLDPDTDELKTGLNVTVPIKVLIPIRDFDVSESSYDLFVGDSTMDHKQLTPVYMPPNYEVDGTLVWSSDDTDVATVDQYGVVTGVAEGTTTIRTYVRDFPQFADTITVNVKVLASDFDIGGQEAGTTKEMEEGQTFHYTTATEPSNCSYTNITWATADSSIVTIDQQGNVTAVAPGTTTISATLDNGPKGNIVATRTIKVLIPIRTFGVTEDNVSLFVGDSTRDHASLTPVYSPTNFEVPGTIEWTSSDTDVATVSNGVVTGVSDGTATITARVIHYGNRFTDTINVNVKVLASGLDITNQAANTEKRISEGEDFTYTTSISPSDSSYTSISWSSSNTTIATVDSNGHVYGVSPGTATITATLTNGYGPGTGTGHDITITRDVKVLVPIRTFELTQANYDLFVGDSTLDHKTITPIYTPTNYEVPGTLNWTSSDTDIATVDSSGVVTGVSEGTVTITAEVDYYKDGTAGPRKYDSVTLDVKVLTDTFDIGPHTTGRMNMEEGQTYQYNKTITPSNSSYKSVTWTSSDSTIATVSNNGLVTAISPGNVTITATLDNGPLGNISVTRDIHVLVPIRTFELTKTNYDLYVGDSTLDHKTITPIYTPTNYEVPDTLNWTSSDTDIATVDANGVVTGVSEGDVIITAVVDHYRNTALESSLTDSVRLHVSVLTDTFDIGPHTTGDLEIEEGETYQYTKNITPSGSSYKSVTWTTSNSTVATVSNTGLVTAVAPGTATITATLDNGPKGNISVSRSIVVPVPIRTFELTGTHYDLYVGDSTHNHVTIAPIFTPSNYEVPDTLNWTSSDETVATVDSNGVVTATGIEGTAIITAVVDHYKNSAQVSRYTDSVTIDVTVLADGFSITNQPDTPQVPKEMEEGETFKYQTSISPSNSSYTSVTWTTSNQSIATVSSDGTVTARSPGDVTITATLTNGLGGSFTTSRNIHVLVPIRTFELTGTHYDLYVTDSNNDHVTIAPIYTPTGYEVPDTLNWTSSDTDIATVDSNGVVTATGNAGTATITAVVDHYKDTAQAADYTDSVTVTVSILTDSFDITNQADTPQVPKEMEEGETFQYQTSILPATSSYKSVTWTTSNSTIATVSSTGLVTARSPGDVTITATLSNGYGSGTGHGHDITVSRNIHVLIPIRTFELTGTSYDLYVGDQTEYQTTIVPIYNPSVYEVPGTLNWTSSDPTVATVNNGVVTGLKEGTTTITAVVDHYKDVASVENYTDSVTVNVKVLASSIDITNQAANTEIDLEEGQTFKYLTSISPNDSSYTSVNWTTSNATIATVAPDGTVTARYAGDVTITATLTNGLNRTLSVSRDIHVKTPIRGFDVTESNVTLHIVDAQNDHTTLHPTYTPQGYEVEDDIIWTSSNENVATVDEHGVVTAHAKGTAVITAEIEHYAQSQNRLIDTVNVEVKLLAESLSITNYPVHEKGDNKIEIGEEFTYTTLIQPTTSSFSSISWSSSDPTIVSVDQTGKITGQNAGDAVITATLTNGLGRTITATKNVHVLTPIDYLDFTTTEFELYIGDSTYDHATIVPDYEPDDYEVDGTLEWESDDEDVVTVDEHGVITAVGEGEAWVSATVSNYPDYYAEAKVTVKILSLGIDFTNPVSTTPIELEVGQEFTYAAVATPSNSNYRTIRWSSSNTSVASINRTSGKAKAIAPGTTTITAEVYRNGLNRVVTATRTLKVLKPIQGYTVQESSVNLYVGDNSANHTTLHPVYYPADHEVDGSLTWTSSDPTVATVENGVVTGLKEGTVTITSTVTKYPQFTFDTTVDVKVLASSFTITNQSEQVKEMEIGDTDTYQTSILPANSSYSSIAWSTSDGNVVTVDQLGNIRAVGYGTATITATLTNGYGAGEGLGHNITVTKNIKVLKPITNFSISETSVNLYVGDNSNYTKQLTPLYSPDDYEAPKTITWTSSDPTVASVDQSTGLVTGLKEGNVTITATVNTKYQQFVDTVSVEVKKLALGLTVQPPSGVDETIVEIGDEYTYQTSINPLDSSYTNISWSSSNTSIVSINQSGKITALSEGTVTITAVLTNGYGAGSGLGHNITVTRTVKVLRPIREFDITESTVNLYIGNVTANNKVLTPVYNPANYEVPGTINWTSSDPTTVSVDSTGKITGLKNGGPVTITGEVDHYKDRPQEERFIDTVTVYVTTLASSLDITNQADTPLEPKEMQVGDTFTYQTEILPEESSYTTIQWSSSNTSVATINSSGQITALTPGTVTITGFLQNGIEPNLTVTRKVKVLKPITDFYIDESNVNLYLGDSDNNHKTLTPVYYPLDFEVPGTINWTSSDPTTVSVDENGVVRALKNGGPVTITAELDNYKDRPQAEDFTKTVQVTVTTLASQFTITNQGNEEKELQVNDEFTYQTNIQPETSSYTNITWSSSNTSVISIDSTGKMTALAAGTSTITATLTNGYGPGTGLGHNIVVTKSVKVLKPITAFDITESTINLYLGDNDANHKTPTLVYSPLDYEVPGTIEWTSSDPTIATVNANGVITAVSNGGPITITGEVKNYQNRPNESRIIDTVQVNVTTLTESFDITNQDANETMDLEVGKEFTYQTSILPANSSYRTINWTSSNTSILTIDSTGKMLGKTAGTVTVTGTITNGIGDPLVVTRQVRVPKAINFFDISESTVDLYIGNSSVDHKQLTPVYSPKDYEVPGKINWTSSDPTIATVDANGVVTAVSNGGPVTITGEVDHYKDRPQAERFIDTVTVNVTTLARSLEITNQASNVTKDVEIGQEFTYQTTITPSTSSYTTINWTSSNTSILSIDSTGKMTGKTAGTVTVTGTLTNGYGPALTVTRQVRVPIPITNFDIREKSVDLFVGYSDTDNVILSPIYYYPDFEVDGEIEWTSSDTDVATVNSGGKVTGLSEGTATITGRVKHYGNQFVKTVTVNVTVLTTNFQILNQNANVTKEMEEGQEFTYQTSIYPQNSSYQTITWSSSKSTVASIDSNGKVTAISPGTTTISATITQGGGKSITLTREIKVLVPIRSFAIKDANHELYIGDVEHESETLIPIYSPTEGYEVPGTIEWTSGDEDVVTVDSNGVITAVDEGDTTVTARVIHYGNRFVSTVNVHVRILTTNFTIDNQSENIKYIDEGEEFIYQTTITPSNSSYRTIEWSSSEPTVATVDENGKVKGFGPGDTVITARVPNGLGQDKVITKNVHVRRPITNFDIAQASVNVYVGSPLHDNIALTPVYTPSNYEVPGDIEWTSSDTDVVTVDEHGVITGANEGDAVITGRVIYYGNKFIKTVNVHVEVLTLNLEILNQDEDVTYDLDIEKTFRYNTRISPSNSSYQTIEWSSENSSIVSVSSNGTITPHKVGTTVIHALVRNPLPDTDVEITRTVRVPKPITDFAVAPTSITLYANDPEDDHVTITPTYTPDDYEVPGTINWTSNDTDVATVDNAVITAGDTEGTTKVIADIPYYEDHRFRKEISVETKIIAREYNILNQPESEKVMEVGDEFTYQTEFVPSNVSYTNVTWTSSNTNAVTVDQNGKIRAVGPGTARISTTLTNGPRRTITTTRDVRVLIPIEDFNITEENVNLYVGDTSNDHKTIVPVYTPSNYEAPKTIEWTSSDPEVATVDQNGLITAIKEGDVTVTAVVTTKYHTFTDSVNVHVKILAQQYNVTLPSGIDEAKLEIGDEYKYNTEVVPSTSSYNSKSWTSSHPEVATVDNEGNVHAIAAGDTVITTVLTNGYGPGTGLGYNITVTRNLHVLRPINSFSITEDTVDLYIGDNERNHKQLTKVYDPSNYEVDGTLEWEIYDGDEIITLGTGANDGLITATTNGTTHLRATVKHYPQYKDTVTVNVKTLASNINITNQNSEDTKQMEIGDEFTYQTEITPETSSYHDVTWTSTDSTVATVNENGKIVAVHEGDTTIRATLTNGLNRTITVERNVHVKTPIRSMSIDEQDNVLYIEDVDADHKSLNITYNPANPEVDRTVTWTSSNPDAVSVDSNGVITAHGKGRATITATSNHYSSIKATTSVEVKVLTSSFAITNQNANDTLELEVDQNNEFEYEYSLLPANSDYKTINWTSTVPGVATVDENGKVETVAPGTTIIKATIQNGLGRVIEVSRTVKVLKPITGFNITESEENLYVGSATSDHIDLTTVISSNGGYEVDDTIEWTSSDTDIATVENGTVTGVSTGTVTITGRLVHYGQEFKDTVTIHVYVLAQEFDISNLETNVTKELDINEEFTLETSIVPPTADYTQVTWSTGDDSIATVTNNGKVKGVSPGTVLITATLDNGPEGTKQATRTIKVLKPITGFNITESSVNLVENVVAQKTATLHTECTPAGYESSDVVSWSSADEEVATIENGVITAQGPGDTIITGTLKNGLSDTVTVHVDVVVEQFVLETPSSINVELGGTYETRTSYLPSNATIGTTVNWTSTDQTIATVDSDGVITGEALGQTTVKGTMNGIEVTINVNVQIGITSFTINETELELAKEDTFQLATTIEPSNTTESKVVTWTSNHPERVSVDEHTGLITAIKPGPATITATLPNGMHVECEVSVITAIDSFTVSPKTATINLNDDNKTVTLTTEILPADAEEDKTITWSSTNDAIASVNNGVVTGEGNGTVTITASLPNGMSDTATITVIKPITSFTVTNGTSHNIAIDQVHTIQTEITPEGTSDSTVISWTSGDDNIATVDSDGNVTGVAYGTTTITGTLPNSRSVFVTIKVLKKIDSIALDHNNLFLYKGTDNDHAQLTAIINPTDAEEDKTVQWSSSNPTIATVDQTGLVTAQYKGTTTITATLANGMSAECQVQVYTPIQSFVLNTETPITLQKGQNITLSTTITPNDTSDSKTITWKSSKTSVATVTSAGKVTAIAGGQATITGTLPNNMKVTAVVNVVVPITSITIGPAQLDMLPGSEKTLNVTINPSNTTEDKTITWATSNPSIVTVENGVLTAHALGQATITATVPSGISTTMIVNVTNTPRTSIRGDFTDDGEVDTRDIVLGLKKVFGYQPITDYDLEVGDIDYNGELEPRDILQILKFVFNYIDIL